MKQLPLWLYLSLAFGYEELSTKAVLYFQIEVNKQAKMAFKMVQEMVLLFFFLNGEIYQIKSSSSKTSSNTCVI